MRSGLRLEWISAALLLAACGSSPASTSSTSSTSTGTGTTGTSGTTGSTGSPTGTIGTSGSSASTSQSTGSSGTSGTSTSSGTSGTTGSTGGKRIFVTHQTYAGNFSTGGGLSAADAACLAVAQAAQLSGSWTAWVSTSSVDAIDRITATGPWSDLSGSLIFADKNALTGAPQSGLWLDEHGQFLGSDRIWTGTLLGGQFDTLDGACLDWTSGSMQELAKIGQVGRTDGSAWTAYSSTTCDQQAHLICLEQ